MDEATWGALAVALTVLGGIVTWLAYRRRGARSGTRWLAVTMLVPAAYLTGTLDVIGEIAGEIAQWAAAFVWKPTVWLGVGLAVLAVLTFLVSMRIPPRQGSRSERRAARRAEAPAGEVGAAPPKGEPAIDDLDDIEAILKRRGIS